MISLPITPACFIISKIDNSTTILPVDIDFSAHPDRHHTFSPFSCKNKCAAHEHIPDLVIAQQGIECASRKKKKTATSV
jgi:hypothetical protein